MTKKTPTSPLQSKLIGASKIHFVLAGLLAFQIILYDASKLITPEVVLKRWLATAGLLVVAVVVWYLAKNRFAHAFGYRILALTLILSDIALASFAVYSQRGMASRAVILYLLAIATAAILASRSALFGTAALCVAAYTATAVGYFVLNFNEGYKVELYGEIGFYSAVLFILAALIWKAVGSKNA